MQPTKSAQPFSRVFPKFYQVKHVFIIPASEPDQHPASFSGLPSAEVGGHPGPSSQPIRTKGRNSRGGCRRPDALGGLGVARWFVFHQGIISLKLGFLDDSPT